MNPFQAPSEVSLMRRCYRLLVFTALLFCLGTSMLAQATSSLRGKVADAQGGALPGVTVVLANTETAFNRQVVTDETGTYSLLQVPPGPYTITAELPGFQTASAKIALQVNTPATLDLRMEIGGLTESVKVEATVAMVNTTDASIGNAFKEVQVRQLPLMTRNVVELLSLQPGVHAHWRNDGRAPRPEQHHARRRGHQRQPDVGPRNPTQSAQQGGLNTGSQRDSGFNAALPVPLDSVQEFRVTVGGQNANQGRSSGGQVSLVTKSGTNLLHGSAVRVPTATRRFRPTTGSAIARASRASS